MSDSLLYGSREYLDSGKEVGAHGKTTTATNAIKHEAENKNDGNENRNV